MDPEQTAQAVGARVVPVLTNEPLTLSSIPPMEPEQTAQAVGARVVKVAPGVEGLAGVMRTDKVLPVQHDEGFTRTQVEARMKLDEAGQLGEIEGGLVQDWLEWESVLAVMEVLVGEDERETCTVRRHVVRIERELRGWWDLGVAGLQEEMRHTVGEVGVRHPDLTLEDVEEHVERLFDTGGAPGPLPGEWHPWLEDFCKARVEKIDEVQGYVDKDRREAEEVLARVYHRQLLLDGQRMVLGALARGLEEWV